MRSYILAYICLATLCFGKTSAQAPVHSKGYIQYATAPGAGQKIINLYFNENECMTTYYSPTSARELPDFKNKRYNSKEDSLKDVETIARLSEAMKKFPINPTVYYRNIKDPFYIKTGFDDHSQKYCMNDSVFPIFDWKLLPDTATILGLKCQKAKGTYQSFEYFAWYAIDLPIPFGPEKKGGLPGLIIQMENPLTDYKISATKIEIPYTGDIEIAPCQNGKSITVAAFAQLLKTQYDEQMRTIKMVEKSKGANNDN